jgi:hypothetical protein
MQTGCCKESEWLVRLAQGEQIMMVEKERTTYYVGS